MAQEAPDKLKMTVKKLLMLAIDAGDIEFIRDSLEELPTLRQLLEEGHFSPLKSTADRISASVWPSFYTGLMPGEHGISHHVQWDADAMRMRRLSGDWFRTEPFWSALEREGLKACVVDVPFTYPGNLANGTEVINWGSHDLMGHFDGFPSRITKEIRRRFGKHPMGYEIPVNKSAREISILHEQLLKGARLKGKLLKWLMQNVEWDLFLGVFGECHRAGHILWPDPQDPDTVIPEGALLQVYREVDTSLGSILNSVDRKTTNIVVFSLHGMRSNFSQEHFTRRIMDRINERFLVVPGPDTESSAGPRRSQSGWVRKLRESIPARLQYAIARAVPVGVRDWVVGREMTGGLDWSRTPGIALRSDVHSFVRFNLKGRERDGTLVEGSEEFRMYRDWVIDNFMALKEVGTDDPIVRDVLQATEIFPGSRSALMPDLVIRWSHRSRATRIYSEALGELEAEPETGRTGEHHTDGFSILLGQAGGVDHLPPLGHNTDFPKFVRHLLNRA
jgi:predicted AlkP superfamily phosphohydrolase/phosphomutase